MKKTLKQLLHDLNNPGIKNLPVSAPTPTIIAHITPILAEYGITSDEDKRLFYRSNHNWEVPSHISKNKTEFRLKNGTDDSMTATDYVTMVKRENLIRNIEATREELETAKADVIRHTKDLAEMEAKLKSLS